MRLPGKVSGGSIRAACQSISSSQSRVCHEATVGISADISTASVFSTLPASVPSVYHIGASNGEESLNVLQKFIGDTGWSAAKTPEVSV